MTIDFFTSQSQDFSDQKWMNFAFFEAEKALEKEEVPIGCVIVRQNRIIAKAHNLVQTLKDPTAHAEILAITSACNHLQSKILDEATLYVTLEPCSMCVGALVLSKIKRLVFAAKDTKTGACGGMVDLLNHEKFNHKIEVSSGISEEKCSQIIKDFFKQKRE